MGDGYALQNKIASGTTITGDIESEGDFRIDGVIKGKFLFNRKSSHRKIWCNRRDT